MNEGEQTPKGKKSQLKIAISWWLVILQAILVRYLKINDSWIEQVARTARKGPVIFVLRNRSLFDFLCLRGICARHGLPPISFVSGLSSFTFSPFWLWLLRLFCRKTVEARRADLSQKLAIGGAAVVFLRRPAVAGALGSQSVKEDGVRLAVETQASLNRPVMALPTVFLWGEHAMYRLPRRMDFVFGSNEYPRLLRSFWLLLRRRSVHELCAGQPLDLSAIRQERSPQNEVLSGIVRAGIGRQIEEIRRSRLGGLTKPSARIKHEVLTSPRLMKELQAIAADENIHADEVTPRARAIIQKLATDFRPRVLAMLAAFMAVVWKRIYTGLEIEPEDVARLKAVVAQGPTLILPTHKSHIDYLVLSQVMQDYGIMLPHIAAGQNLAFWPLGWVFRSSGAFFIRRRFIHDRFYTAVVNAYVRRLIQTGYAIEVFIEGGRSRTGKMLRPKGGMVEMALKAVADIPQANLSIVPAFIGYERVIEERSYVDEIEGRPKQAENITGLLKSTKVLFSRYGRLYVRIGKPFTVADVMNELQVGREQLQKLAHRRAVAQAIAMRNLHEINRITVVTPSAVLSTILLTHRPNQIDHQEFRRQAIWLCRVLVKTQATLSPMLQSWLQADGVDQPKDLIDKAIKAFVKMGRIGVEKKSDPVVYHIKEGQRLPLDYYKNNIIHFLVPLSLLCTACLIEGDECERHVWLRRMALSSRLYHWEFFSPACDLGQEEHESTELDTMIQQGIEVLENQDVLELNGDRLKILDRTRALFLSHLLLNFHELYFAALTAIREKAFKESTGSPIKRATAIAEKRYAQGEFIRPEGRTKVNLQNAIQTFKDLKIQRINNAEEPFEEQALGTQILTYLEQAVRLR